MNSNEMLLSNLSYTNKDFNAIYPELLDLADRISTKWKPSLSDESDPGVVLLKLQALMADKNNYNIDKNILELFPSSVTQYPNAREIYDQCGYTMHHYIAAEVTTNLVFDTIREDIAPKDKDGNSITIDKYKSTAKLPIFTMLSDEDQEIVYTIIHEINDLSTDPSPYIELKFGKPTSVKCLQGKINDYQINSNSIITYGNLDYNNRIYFTESNIAENGIFIQNIDANGDDTNNYSKWHQVENLIVEELGTYCYKFGISRDGQLCYIEFPSDASSLIGNGIKIKYITTDGISGMISKKVLSRFFNETSADFNFYTTENSTLSGNYSVTSDDIFIANDSPSKNGSDPETIDEADKNYQMFKNTFNTLVSSQDYTNFLRRSNEVSNGYITSRKDDIQDSYKIQSYENGIDKVIYKVAKDTKGKVKMSATDMKMYGLAKPSGDFDPLGFTPVITLQSKEVDPSLRAVEDSMEDIKSLQHDFIAVSNNQPIFIFLYFPINLKVIPYSRLDNTQINELLIKVHDKLTELLSSSNLEFGEALDYGYIYDSIIACDSRIQTIILDEFTYDPKICSGNNEELADKEIDGFKSEILAKCVLAGVTPYFTFDEDFTYGNDQQSISTDTVTGTGDKLVYIETSLSLNALREANNDFILGLAPNESIYLSAPSYTDAENYSNYVRYYTNVTEIPKDSYYTLDESGSISEYLAFFWRSADGDPYNFHIYKSDKVIIHPNTSLKYNIDVNDGIHDIINKLMNSTSPDDYGLYSGTASDDQSSKIAGFTKKCTLSGLNEVFIQKPVIVNIGLDTLSTKAYWITNNIQDNAYILKTDSDGMYEIQFGETFYYTNSQETQLSILGPGTRLHIKNQGGEYANRELGVNQAEDTFSLLANPLEYLSDNKLWHDLLDNRLSIDVHERQFYNIGAESTIRFIPPSSTSDLSFSSSDYNELMQYKISYLPKGSEDWTQATSIPYFNSSIRGWEGKALLSIDSSSSKPQLLTSKCIESCTASERSQTVTFYNKNATSLSINSESTEKYFQLYPSFSYIGGYKCPIDSEVKIYQYTKKTSDGTDGITYQPDGSTIYKFSIKDTTSIPAPLELQPKSVYRLVLENAPKEAKLNFKQSTIEDEKVNADVTFLNFDTSTKIAALYSYYLLNDKDSTIQLTLPYNDVGDYVWTLSAVQKYTDTLDKDTSTPILSLMKTLDYDHEFNYLYKVPKSIEITDPLEGKSFLDKNHPYNPYTICKWPIENKSIVVKDGLLTSKNDPVYRSIKIANKLR